MKSAPFSMAPAVFIIYIVVAIIGAIVASILSGIGLSGWLGFFLTAVIAFSCGGIVRSFVTSLFGSLVGISGSAPTAGSFAVRLAIAAVIAAVLAFLLSQASEVFPFGALSGALISFVTVAVASLIFTLMLARS